jgi:hypothetical protein
MGKKKKNEAATIIGKRYGKWVVKGQVESRKGSIYYACVCDCGQKKEVAAISLRNGNSTSCGCGRVEKEIDKVLGSEGKTQADPKDIATLTLISQGILPPADQISIKGSPAWTIDSIAKLLGVEKDYLISRAKEAGARFGGGAQKEEPAQGWAVS